MCFWGCKMFSVWLENYVNLRKNCQICKCSEGMLTSLKQLLQVCHAMILCLFCFKSFSKNIKDFLKKFKDFFRKLLHVFRCANMAVGCWCVVPASVAVSFLFFEEDILFFTLLFFSLLCKRVVLKISWLRRFSNVLIHFWFTFTSHLNYLFIFLGSFFI